MRNYMHIYTPKYTYTYIDKHAYMHVYTHTYTYLSHYILNIRPFFLSRDHWSKHPIYIYIYLYILMNIYSKIDTM
jgi:hypothetical protein